VLVGQDIKNADILPGTIKGVVLRLGRKGNPTDNLVVALRATRLGADLTSARVSAATLFPDAAQEVRFIFDTPSIPTSCPTFEPMSKRK